MSELLIIATLIRKLGGEVELTEKDLIEAEELELQCSESDGFIRGIRYRVRTAPVTIEGETVPEVLELPRG